LLRLDRVPSFCLASLVLVSAVMFRKFCSLHWRAFRRC
jgi:hypothetical protein